MATFFYTFQNILKINFKILSTYMVKIAYQLQLFSTFYIFWVVWWWQWYDIYHKSCSCHERGKRKWVHMPLCSHARTSYGNYKGLNGMELTIHAVRKTVKIRNFSFETGRAWTRAWKVSRIWRGRRESGRTLLGKTRRICSDHVLPGLSTY